MSGQFIRVTGASVSKTGELTVMADVSTTVSGGLVRMTRGVLLDPHRKCSGCDALLGTHAWRPNYNGNNRMHRWCDWCILHRVAELLAHSRDRAVEENTRLKDENTKQAVANARLHLTLDALHNPNMRHGDETT